MKQRSFLLIGLLFGGVSWLAETAIHAYVFQQSSFSDMLFPANTNEIWMRLVIIALFIGFGILVQRKVDQVRCQEQHYRDVMSSVFDIYYRADLDGRLIEVSPSSEQQTGYGPEEITGRFLTDFYAEPEQRQEFMRLLKLHGKIKGFEVSLKHKDGSVKIAAVSSHLVLDGENNPFFVEGVLHDITKRKQAENKLAEKTAYLDSILRSATNCAIATTDLDLRITYYNPMAENLFGYAAEEVIGKTVQEIGMKEKVKPERFDKAIENVRRFGEHLYTVNQKTGHGMRVLKSRISAIRDINDELCGYALFSYDVTNRKNSEAKLHRSLLDIRQAEAAALNMMEDAHAARIMAEQAEAEMKKMAAASQSIVGLHDIAEIYGLICDAALEIFDLKLAWLGLIEETSYVITPVAISGISSAYVSSITVSWDDRHEGCGPSGRAVKAGCPQVSEDIEHDSSFQPWLKKARRYGFRSMLVMPLISADDKVVGVLHLYSHETGFFNQSRVNMIATFANQAELAIENARLLASLEQRVKKRTQQMEIARDQAQASNRAKSTFLANMSHELRTPLNSILGFSELLSLDQSHPLHSEQLSQLDFVLESGTRLLNLINDLLDLSKIEAGKMELDAELFDVRELLNHAIKHHAHALEQQGLVVHCDFTDDIALCKGDMQKIHQVLDNLLSNAIKFTPAGGTISVQASRVKAEALGDKHEGFDVSGKEQASLVFLKISVTDSGIGIAEADQGKLFQPFQQLDGELNRKYEGTGLGLSLCRKIITMHGGDIWLEKSEPGKGSTFTFIIPADETQA